MATHDPRKAVELLRNHLATHDQQLAFLFGAGVSCAVRDKATGSPLIPAVAALTETCGNHVKGISAEFSNAWLAIQKECTDLGLDNNIEVILSRIRGKLAALGPADNTLGLKVSELAKFEQEICESIAKQVSPAPSLIPDNSPHDQFALWLKAIRRKSAIEIFTTNYDVLIERSLEEAQVPLFDGFSGSYLPFFNTECFDDEGQMPPPEWVRLWKLHGSVNWTISENGGKRRVIRDQNATKGEMILPSHLKYEESKKLPYQALMDRLHTTMKKRGALLVTSGFSFGDQHINSILFDALEAHSLTHIISLQFGDIAESSELSKLAERYRNFLVFGRNAAVIQGVWGEWKLATPIDANSAPFMDKAFAPVDPGTASGGQLKLGDFAAFCAFLETMGFSGGSLK